MEQKQNKWGVLKGLAFPIGYFAFMNVGQMILTALLTFVLMIRSVLAVLTSSGANTDPTLFLEWFNQDNTTTSMKYAMFFSALTTIGALVILWLVFQRKGKSFAEYFHFKPAPAKAIIAAVLLGLSLHFIVNAVLTATNALTTELLEMLFRALEALDPSIAQELRTFYESYMEMMSSMNSDVGMFTVAAVLGAPLIEELVFRAGPLTNFKGKMPTFAAVLITSALFGLAHGAPIQVAYTFVLGIVIAYLFIKSDSIYPAIIAHFCFNAANLLPMAVEGLLGGPNQTPAMEAWFNALYTAYVIVAAIIAVPMLIVGIVLLVKLRRPAPATKEEQPAQSTQPQINEQAEPAPIEQEQTV